MIGGMKVSDQTPFKAFIFINISNLNETFFFAWFNYFDNSIYLLPDKECNLKYYYHLNIITFIGSISQPEFFLRTLCMVDIIVI